MAKIRKFDVGANIRAIARERVGRPAGTRVFTPATRRRPKHAKKEAEDAAV